MWGACCRTPREVCGWAILGRRIFCPTWFMTLTSVVVLLDLPPALDQPHQPPRRVVGGKIAQAVLGGGLLRLRPLDQQPHRLARRPAVLIAMGWLDSRRPEAGFQPTLASFPPANLLPAPC